MTPVLADLSVSTQEVLKMQNFLPVKPKTPQELHMKDAALYCRQYWENHC